MNLKSPLILNSQVVILNEDEVIDALKAKFGSEAMIGYQDKGCVYFSNSGEEDEDDNEEDFHDIALKFLGDSLGVDISDILCSDGDQRFDGLLVFYSEKVS